MYILLLLPENFLLDANLVSIATFIRYVEARAAVKEAKVLALYF